jgi:7tm Odorant receptor
MHMHAAFVEVYYFIEKKFPLRYPMDLASTPQFAAAFGYQMISLFVNMVTNITLDLFIVGIIMHVNAQVQRLAYRLTLVTSDEELRECIDVHQKLLR